MTMTVGTPVVPASVEIGPFTYDVSLDPADIDALAPEAFAVIDPGSLLIALEPAQDPGQMRDSLLHEVLHGITFVTGLANDMPASELEEIVNRISPMLLDALRRNLDLIEFLTAEP